jgi:DNA-binding SARP family transcriptional activator
MGLDLRRRVDGGVAPAIRASHARADYRLSLLRSFELRHDGEPVDLPLSGQRVIALLALRDRPVLRAHAAGTLWPETSEDRAAASLRSALWRLGQTAGSLVEARATHLRLSPTVAVDVRSMTEVARCLIDRSTDIDVRELFGVSLSGELLPDWYDDWVLTDRERLRQLRLHALESLCDRLTEAGELGAALGAGLAAVAAEPLRESAHRVLIRVHLAEGNHAEAVRQYLFFRRILREELDLEPSRQIEELMREMTFR